VTQEREIIAVNVDLSCDRNCEGCEKFFDCQAPYKLEIYLRRRMDKARSVLSNVKYKIAVAAGKGGVGKSTLSANLATALAAKGYKVTILDQDFDGPSIPRMLGIMGKKLKISDEGILPVEGFMRIQVISTGSILSDDDILTWFHDMRRNATEEFLSHVVYGERDFLIIDLPPGTSSDTVNVLQYIPKLDGTVMVTIPSEVSQGVARRAIHLFQKAGIPVLGVVENMSGVVCEECGAVNHVLGSGGGEKLANDMDIPFLGRIPMDHRLSSAMDHGVPFITQYPDSPAVQALMGIVSKVEETLLKDRSAVVS